MHDYHFDECTRRTFLRNTACGAAAAGLGAFTPQALADAQALAATGNQSATRPAGPEPKLPHGVLGRTKHPVTLVSLGAILLQERAGTRVLQTAIDRGVNLVHTSASYGKGKSVAACGALFKAKPEYREKVFLCLKSFHPGRESEIDEMLRDLHTDHAEAVLTTLHNPEPERLDAIREQQDNLKKKGKVRHTGFVCHVDMNGVIEMVLDKAPEYFDMTLMCMKLVPSPDKRDGEPDENAARFLKNLKALRAEGIGILSMKSGARKAVTRGVKVFEPHIKAYLEVGADSMLTSMDTLEQIEMTTGLNLKNPHLTRRERQAAADFHRQQAGSCLMCGDCNKVCPQRLPISDLMRVRMYREEYGWHEHAANEYASLGVDFTQAAAACGDCSACTTACPVKLAAPETINKVASAFA